MFLFSFAKSIYVKIWLCFKLINKIYIITMFIKLYYKFMKLKTPRVIFPFFMALIMAFIMSGVLAFINIGPVANFLFIWMKSFVIAFCVAFPVAFFVAPLVNKIVKIICE